MREPLLVASITGCAPAPAPGDGPPRHLTPRAGQALYWLGIPFAHWRSIDVYDRPEAADVLLIQRHTGFLLRLLYAHLDGVMPLGEGERMACAQALAARTLHDAAAAVSAFVPSCIPPGAPPGPPDGQPER
ncbi:MAG: hypothetical protein EYC70_00415 [Planctomycetota bacterium]|nr:MAG: hypothetical protein EYC70_00415 [Planctomycetota bacterium]